MLPHKVLEQPAFLQLGRYGDLVLLLPAWKAVHDRLQKPIVFVSREFANLFEGVSYIDVRPLPFHWTNQTDKAIQFARRQFPNVIVTQLHGHNWTAKPDKLPSYSWSMWERTGLLDEYHSLPLVFDRRNKAREQSLCKALAGERRFLLTKFHGITSPFGYLPEVDKVLRHVIPKDVRIVRMDQVNAFRPYDLIGLMDAAIGMITVDTMTLHLAPASPNRYIAFTRDDGQARSIPKGNCVLNIGYNETRNRLEELEATLKTWI